MIKTAVVILNWNGKSLLEQYLPSVIQHSGAATVYVADNGSTDDSLTFLKQHYPSVKTILLDQNYGFCGGYNRALKGIDAEYYVLLNSDVEVTSNWIDPIITLMDANVNLAVCQPKILSYKQKDHFEYAGAAGGFLDRNGYPFCRGRIFNHLEKDNGQYDTILNVHWATGACMFIKAKLFHENGGFDEHFFAHMEEIDLCWRLRNRGYNISCVPESIVYHLGGGTLNQLNPKKTFLNFRNGLAMMHKNHPNKGFLLTLLKRLFLDGIAGIKFFLEGDFKHTFAVMKAHISYYGLISKLNAFRKKESGFVKVYKATDRKNIVWLHFARGIKKFTDL